MTTRTVKWLSAFVVLVMVVMAVPQTASAETLPTVVITEDTVLTADLNAHVVIGADGITLDGAGHSILGYAPHWESGVGISLIGRSGVTIKNCRVSGFWDGICLDSSNDNLIVNNTLTINHSDTSGAGSGISLISSCRNTMANNAAYASGRGFYLYSSDYNILTRNTADSNYQYGFFLYQSCYNTLTDNVASRNALETELDFFGGFAVGDNSNLVANNTAIDNHGCGFGGGNLRGNTATGNYIGFSVGGLLEYVEGNLAYGNNYGFRLKFRCSESTLVNNTARDNHVGFFLMGENPVGYSHHYLSCHHNLLVRNTAINNTERGFDLLFAERNTFMYNVAHDNGDDLHELFSKHNKFIHNDFDDKK